MGGFLALPSPSRPPLFRPPSLSSSMAAPVSQLMAKESVLIQLGFGDLDSLVCAIGDLIVKETSRKLGPAS